MGVNYSAGPIVRDGLVLYLDAGNTKSYPGSGTVWRDLSGNGNDGTLTNGPTYSSDNLGSIVFDGSNDRITCNLNYNTSPPEWTGILWAKRSASIQTNGTGGQGLELGFNHNTNVIGGNVENINGSDVFRSFNVPSNQVTSWNMISGTYDQTNLSFFMNGNLVYHDGVGSRTIATFDSVYINYTLLSVIDTVVFNSNNTHVAGDVAVALIYDRALTQQEILQNYNATKGRYGL